MFSTVDAHCFSVFQLRSSVAADTQPLFYFTPLGPGLCARPVVGSPFMPPLPSLVLTGGASPWRQWSHSAPTAVDSLPGPRQLPSLPGSSPKRWGCSAAGSTPAACPHPRGLPRAAADCPGRTRLPPPRFPAVPRGASHPAAWTAPARTGCCSGSSHSCKGTGVTLVKAASALFHPEPCSPDTQLPPL